MLTDYNAKITSTIQPAAAGFRDSETPLVVITGIASLSLTKGLQIARFAMQSAARDLLPTSRVGFCRRRVIPTRETVEVWYSPEGSRAYYLNLATCGLIWNCPVCAARITEQRRRKLETAFAQTEKIVVLNWEGEPTTITANKFKLGLATFTIAHKRDEPAATVLKRLQSAYRKLWSGRWAQGLKKKYGVIGTLGGLELTHGDSGWHPHIHSLWIADSVFTPTTELQINIELKRRWQESVAKVGGYASEKAGFDFRAGDEKALEYISKNGDEIDKAARKWSVVDEITKYPVKRGKSAGRTLWQLLIDYMGGDKQAGALWVEGVTALKGQKYMRPSPNLWDVLGVDKDIDSDENMACEHTEPTDRLLAALSLYQWRTIIQRDVRGELLEVASSGDPAMLAGWLRQFGIQIDTAL